MPLVRNLIAVLSKQDRRARPLYDHCVAAARAPEHYLDGHVADSVDGRFDMLTLHLFILAHRLRGAGAGGAAMLQSLIDCFVRDMDRNLREMGAGDIGVAKRVRHMALVLNGQLHGYERALTEGTEALAESILRNIVARPAGADEAATPTASQHAAARRLAVYVVAQALHLSFASDAECAAGRCRMQPPATAYGEDARAET